MRDDVTCTATQSDYFEGYERGYKVGKQEGAGSRASCFVFGFVLCAFIAEVLRHVW